MVWRHMAQTDTLLNQNWSMPHHCLNLAVPRVMLSAPCWDANKTWLALKNPKRVGSSIRLTEMPGLRQHLVVASILSIISISSSPPTVWTGKERWGWLLSSSSPLPWNITRAEFGMPPAFVPEPCLHLAQYEWASQPYLTLETGWLACLGCIQHGFGAADARGNFTLITKQQPQ